MGTSSSLAIAIALLGACASEDERCPSGPAPVTVVGSEVRDHYVRLDLQYSGGCKQHEFAVWWSGVGAPSNPPQIPFELQHYDHDDACEALVTDAVWLDLSSVNRLNAGGRVLIDFYLGMDGASDWLTRVDYTPAADAPAPAAEVLTVDETCGTFGR